VPRWTADGTTERNGYPAGDDQAAEAGRSASPPGIRAVIDVDTYAAVTTRDDDGNPVGYGAEAMIQYTVCRDIADSGGTEIWSGIEYGTGRDPGAYRTAEEADKAACKLALTYQDNPDHFTWSGRPEPSRVDHPIAVARGRRGLGLTTGVPGCLRAGIIAYLVTRAGDPRALLTRDADYVGVHPLAAIGQEPAGLPVVSDHHSQARGVIQRGQVTLLVRGQFFARAAAGLSQERVIPAGLVMLGAYPPGDEILTRSDAPLDAHGPELAADHGTIGPPPGLPLIDAGNLVKGVTGFRQVPEPFAVHPRAADHGPILQATAVAVTEPIIGSGAPPGFPRHAPAWAINPILPARNDEYGPPFPRASHSRDSYFTGPVHSGPRDGMPFHVLATLRHERIRKITGITA
jgi:hypothetical protein